MDEGIQLIVDQKARLMRKAVVLRVQLGRVNKELSDLDGTLLTLKKLGVNIPVEIRPKTIGELFLNILAEYPQGLTTKSIYEIALKHDSSLKRTSAIAPLCRLRDGGVLKYENKRWRLAWPTSL